MGEARSYLDHPVFRDPVGEHTKAGKRVLASTHLFAADLVVFAILQRSLDLVRGVKSLLGEENLTCAVALTRLQMDSLARLAYMATLPDTNQFALQILAGEPLYKVKDAAGKPLTDSRLREYAAQTHPWIDDLYEKASRFIHLSDEHIFTAVKLDEREGGAANLLLSIVERPDRWSSDLIDEVGDTFAYITERLLDTTNAWGDHKVALAARRASDADAHRET